MSKKMVQNWAPKSITKKGRINPDLECVLIDLQLAYDGVIDAVNDHTQSLYIAEGDLLDSLSNLRCYIKHVQKKEK